VKRLLPYCSLSLRVINVGTVKMLQVRRLKRRMRTSRPADKQKIDNIRIPTD